MALAEFQNAGEINPSLTSEEGESVKAGKHVAAVLEFMSRLNDRFHIDLGDGGRPGLFQSGIEVRFMNRYET